MGDGALGHNWWGRYTQLWGLLPDGVSSYQEGKFASGSSDGNPVGRNVFGFQEGSGDYAGRFFVAGLRPERFGVGFSHAIHGPTTTTRTVIESIISRNFTSRGGFGNQEIYTAGMGISGGPQSGVLGDQNRTISAGPLGGVEFFQSYLSFFGVQMLAGDRWTMRITVF